MLSPEPAPIPDCVETPSPWRDDGFRLTFRGYLLGLLTIFIASYSQYVIGLRPIAGAFVVYGVSILATGLLYGRAILRRSASHTHRALELGLAFFGIFTVLGIVASIIILSFLGYFDPKAAELLQKPIPVLDVPKHLAWIMIWVSFIVVGPAEEFLFRGFVFGGLLGLYGPRHWILYALISSLLFAAVHLYYALTFGPASLVVFAQITALGLAFAFTYYLTGGNLLIPALIHGAFDAFGFIGVATTLETGLRLRGVLILTGLVVAIVTFRRWWTGKSLG